MVACAVCLFATNAVSAVVMPIASDGFVAKICKIGERRDRLLLMSLPPLGEMVDRSETEGGK